MDSFRNYPHGGLKGPVIHDVLFKILKNRERKLSILLGLMMWMRLMGYPTSF